MNLCKIFCILLVFSLALVTGQDLGDDDEFAEFEDFEESDSNFVEEETASETLSNEQFTPPPSEKIMGAQDDLDDEVSYVYFFLVNSHMGVKVTFAQLNWYFVSSFFS